MACGQDWVFLSVKWWFSIQVLPGVYATVFVQSYLNLHHFIVKTRVIGWAGGWGEINVKIKEL